jgi:hypothetical protein
MRDYALKPEYIQADRLKKQLPRVEIYQPLPAEYWSGNSGFRSFAISSHCY